MVRKLFEGDSLVDGAVCGEEGFAEFAEAETTAETFNSITFFIVSNLELLYANVQTLDFWQF